MLGDEITLTLNSPITDEQFDALTDVDMENTPRIVFHTKSGKEVEYLKVVRCKDCVHFEPNIIYTLEGIPIITAHEICTKFENICKTKTDGFCNFGERRSE